MEPQLPILEFSNRNRTIRSPFVFRKSFIHLLVLFITTFPFLTKNAHGQGTWTALTRLAPDLNGGVMLLLSDGTVMAKTFSGGGDGVGNIWNKLTPDAHGSYANGTWSQTIAPMHDTRLYFSSQLLRDGRVYVAGGEYGTGGYLSEVYNPLTNVWTTAPTPGRFISDANSEILPDGGILQALVTGTLRSTYIYDPVNNTQTAGPNCKGIHNESAWLKLPDNSILFVDRQSKNSERYIPSLNQWVADATVPVALYDPYGLETGAAFLLPDGRGFFLGATGHTAYYTPSGNNSAGAWAAGPDIPNQQGTPDAAGAMMINGKILCAVSPIPTSGNHFPTPTSYYEFNYRTNAFKRVGAPGGGLTSNVPCYYTNMLDLPDGTVLFCLQNSNQYYIYTPDRSALVAGKPTIKKITRKSATYTLTGTKFNGISEGASYGDDWQMNTNYPIVRLASGGNVYYARTFNWNRTGVKTGNLRDTTKFKLPSGLPLGSYALSVIANGISSDTITFTNSATFENEIASTALNPGDDDIVVAQKSELSVYPNPALLQTMIHVSLPTSSHVSLKVFDLNGKEIRTLMNGDMLEGEQVIQFNTTNLPAGMYIIRMVTETEVKNVKLLVR